MNWRIDTTSDKLAKAEPIVELAENEDAEPSKPLVNAARKAARELAAKQQGTCSIEIHGHETTKGRGFRPGHVTVTVSKLKK